jgi:hypothetical protein
MRKNTNYFYVMGSILRSYIVIVQTNNSLTISSNLSTQAKHSKSPYNILLQTQKIEIINLTIINKIDFFLSVFNL